MMERVVHYHYPYAENFSLTYSSASASEILARRNEADDATKLIG
nr:hypothetical protein [Halorientalis marina]